jgi:hypothetical protein
MRTWRRVLLIGLVATLTLGTRVAVADIHGVHGDNVQEGDNDADSNQRGQGASGDAIAGGQVVGGVVSGTARVDATNRSVDARAKSGDAEGSNSAGAFTGNNASGGASCPTPQDLAATADCPATQEGFIGQPADIDGNISGLNIQEGDNDQTIRQHASADSGDAAAGGQIVGFVGAGIQDIVVSNDSVDAKAKSGDADANNSIDDAEVSNFTSVSGACPTCPLPDIGGATISAAIVQEGENDQTLDQSADASSGDALAGTQVVGAVTSATGRTSIDGTNRSRDADAKSGDAETNNDIGLAVAGNTALDVAGDCCGLADINADSINAAIVHEGDNDQSIGQTAVSSSGDSLAGAEVVGSVDAGSSDIAVSNDSIDAKARSGDADSNNSIDDAESGNFVSFAAACIECFSDSAVVDISGGTISAVILHEGDNDQTIDQVADASSGDALAGSQVVGSVTGAGGDTSIDATNRSRDADAKSGDSDADNDVVFAAVGNAAEDVPLGPTASDIGGDHVTGVIIQEGDNDNTIDEKARASSGDALGGAQVIGSVSGGRTSIVESNDGRRTDVTSGDASFSNRIGESQTGNEVLFAGCPPCPIPGPVSARTKAGETGVILVALAGVALSRRRRRVAVVARRSDVRGDRLV